MATFLLIIIYIAFISLGVPDSLLGTAWPAIYTEFDLPISYANILSVFISVCTLISSVVSARIINKFGTPIVSALSTSLTALALFGYSISNSFLWLMLCAIPLGAGAGAIDSGLNNYVALHYKATHMSFLHCFYGVGVSISPYLMSISLSDNANWRGGYRFAFYIQITIAVIMILTLPVWKKAKHTATEYDEVEQVTVPFIRLIKRKDIRAAAMVFFASCSIEFLCGVWGCTFLVKARGMAIDYAAKMLTFYYVGLAFGRFLSGVFANKLKPRQIMTAGHAVIFVAIVLIFIPYGYAFAAAGLFLVGMGNGPIYPNMMHLTPEHFGAEISQSVMGVQLTGAYIGILATPLVFGLVAEKISVGLFSVFLAVMYVIMIAYTKILQRRCKGNVSAQI